MAVTARPAATENARPGPSVVAPVPTRLNLRYDPRSRRGGACIGIVDAKYKALDDRRFPNADAYQMLAYCTAFEVPRGFLVYARDAIGDPWA